MADSYATLFSSLDHFRVSICVGHTDHHIRTGFKLFRTSDKFCQAVAIGVCQMDSDYTLNPRTG